MSIPDKLSTQIEFEFDRDAIQRLYRVEGWLICALPMLTVFLMFSSGMIAEQVRTQPSASWQYTLGLTVLYVLGAVVSGLAIGTVIYFCYFHRAAVLYAKNLRLLVEGPYLRCVTGAYVVVDQRIHFQDIHACTTIEGPLLRRFGLKCLAFSTPQRQVPPIRLDGVKDADHVRDMLCEIAAGLKSTYTAGG